MKSLRASAVAVSVLTLSLAGPTVKAKDKVPGSISVAFGAGHLVQGYDVAIVTGLLGAFWGVVYLRRRSAVAPIVSHAGFNSLEIVRYLVGGV